MVGKIVKTLYPSGKQEGECFNPSGETIIVGVVVDVMNEWLIIKILSGTDETILSPGEVIKVLQDEVW
jgi:hypothetical protein